MKKIWSLILALVLVISVIAMNSIVYHQDPKDAQAKTIFKFTEEIDIDPIDDDEDIEPKGETNE